MISFTKSLSIFAVASLLLTGCAVPGSSQGTSTTAPKTEAGSTTATNVNTQPNSGKKLKVVTTFYPMYDFTKNITGDLADVSILIPTGVEPHDWEPTAKDIQALADSDVFVYNGIVEGWVPDTLKSINNKNLKAVEASKGLELMQEILEEGTDGHKDEHGENLLDPHVWLDPVLAQKEVLAIEKALEEADPAHKDEYNKNAEAFISKLKALDKEFNDTLSKTKRKEFVTQHAAFGYLAKQYGLTQIPISGLSPDVEPSPAKLVEIVTFAKEKKVGTIFFEELVSPKIAETVAKEIGAKSEVLSPIEGLSDEEKANGLDYIGVMKTNLKSLQTALNK